MLAALPAEQVARLDRYQPYHAARAALLLVQQHEREQTEDLRLVRQQASEHVAEADRLATQVGAFDVRIGGPMAAGEDQVDGCQHRREALGQLGPRRDAVGDARVANLPLRPHQPLGHGRLRHEKRVRGLGGAEAADDRRPPAPVTRASGAAARATRGAQP